MRTHRLLMLAIPLIGCYGPESVGPSNNNMMNCSADGGMRIDMSPSKLPCPAAKGLSGDTLACVDFQNIASLSSQTEWSFNSSCSDPKTNKAYGWTLASSAQTMKKTLLMVNYSEYIGDCAFTTPRIDLTNAQYSGYNRLTISLQTRINVNPQAIKVNTTIFGPQFAQIYLNNNSPVLINQTTGQNHPQQLTLSLDKSSLPTMPSGGYQFFVNFHAPYAGGGGNDGWEIDSIAINGSKD